MKTKSAKSEKEALRTIVNFIRKHPKDNTSIPICYVNCGGTFTIDAFASSSQKVDFSVLTNAASKETEAYASANIKGWGQSIGGKMEYKNSNDSNESNRSEQTESNINVTFKHQSMPKCSSVSELEEKLSKGASEWFLSLDITKGVKMQKINVLEIMKEQAIEMKDDDLREDLSQLTENIYSAIQNNTNNRMKYLGLANLK